MIALVAAAVSVAGAGLVAAAGFAGEPVLAGSVALIVLVIALGWGALLRLPHPRGTAVLVALTGLAAVVLALNPPVPSRPLAGFAGLIAGGVLAAFVHELIRRDGRPRLVASVTGTLCGQVVVVLAAGWLLLPGTRVSTGGVVVAAVAVAVTRVVAAVPSPPRITGWVSFAVGAAAAALASALVDSTQVLPAVLMGVAVAGVTAALERLLAGLPDSRRGLGLYAAASVPVAAGGTVAYAAVRLLGS